MSVLCTSGSNSICEGGIPNYCEGTVTIDPSLSYITGDWILFTCIDNPCLSLVAQVVTYNTSSGALTYDPYLYYGIGS